ncbi:hypothetical protein [Reinekea marinisedimentorum]|uniref:HEPN AbiU2-like domain-containing protein n=1 Tax=Reinekea marinisedimentorum TaxID=230495 RepID=A0A4R3HVI1_9GAMM|nr:hypothetical protein [Reinekea marinisedimentorum]TCS36774.1 hypothetical protein BCF53_12248 [Reinekea marinisedimentorum]
MKITEQQLIRAIYSVWDFQQALSALTFLLEGCDFNESYSKVDLRRFRCYESTLIVSMARPFETTRGGTTIGLRALGISLSKDQKDLVERILDLRRKIIAHSSEEEMHFRASTFTILDDEYNLPHFQFNEGLHLNEQELLKLELFLRELRQKMATFFFKVAQEQPEMIQKYKEPESFKVEKNGIA